VNDIINYLEKLGLSEAEAKLYITLLKSGPITVRELAKAVEIKRTTAYMHIEQLVERGLVMRLIKGSNKLIAATEPDSSLDSLVQKKLQKAKDIEKNFPSILDKISTSLPDIKTTESTEIKFFKGMGAVKRIYAEAFKGNELRSYVKVEDIPVLSSNNPVFFAEAFKKNKKLKVWEIMYDSPISRRQAFKTLSKANSYFYKFMPSELKWSITSEDILIYDGKVAIINYKGNVSTTVLQSSDFYNNSKEIFDFIWRIIPNPDN